MADVTGPISTLPGSRHAVPEGLKCDNHPDRPAVKRVQGETDSFGSEMHDLCQECADKIVAAIRKPRDGACDWCKSPAIDLRNARDFEEGMSGRVYLVCGACIRKQNEDISRDLAETDDLPDPDPDPDWPDEDDEEEL